MMGVRFQMEKGVTLQMESKRGGAETQKDEGPHE